MIITTGSDVIEPAALFVIGSSSLLNCWEVVSSKILLPQFTFPINIYFPICIFNKNVRILFLYGLYKHQYSQNQAPCPPQSSATVELRGLTVLWSNRPCTHQLYEQSCLHTAGDKFFILHEFGEGEFLLTSVYVFIIDPSKKLLLARFPE